MDLRTIAARAGVSAMTVSRVLRKDPHVSTATRAKVQSIADGCDYRPNPLVSALMNHRRSGKPAKYDLKLGFITAFNTRNQWREMRLYREFFAGAAASAIRQGYQLEEFWLREPGMTPRRLSQILLTRNIHGLLVAPLPAPQGSVDLEWRDFSAVSFGYSLACPDLHRVCNHQFRSMRLLCQKLSEMGYRKPGLALSQSLDDRVLHQWLGGFMVLAQNSSPNHRVPLFVVPDDKWNRQRFLAWLHRQQPDVVIGHQEELLEWMRQAGIEVPQQIGFVHLDCPAPDGPISGIYQNGTEIGIAAADALVAMLHRNERGVPQYPRTLLIEGSWVKGTTCKPAGLGNSRIDWSAASAVTR